jgi:hypothetical protein
MIDVDPIAEAVAELHTLVGLGCPGGGALGLRLSLGFSIKGIEILGDRALLLLLVSPTDLARRHAVIAAGIGLQDAGVDSEALALDQSHRHRRPHHTLEDVAQQIAVAEPAQSVL